MFLLKKYNAHINVEWCNKTRILKYLFKYVTKGQDSAKIYLSRLTSGQDAPYDSESSAINGVKEYLDCRYICEQDAVWRILGYDIHRHFPPVERLVVHLPHMNNLSLRPNDNLARVVSNSFLARTPLTAWLDANRDHEDACSLTYWVCLVPCIPLAWLVRAIQAKASQAEWMQDGLFGWLFLLNQTVLRCCLVGCIRRVDAWLDAMLSCLVACM